MALTKTPICDFGKKAEAFKLKSTDDEIISLENIKGKKGTIIMFICNHCPYVKAVINEIVSEIVKSFNSFGVNSVAISSNFFGFNEKLELQYRGRIRELRDLKPISDGESDLYKAMLQISKTGKGPIEQIPSMGCNIKWKNS